MTRSGYYKWLLALYIITGIVFYKSVSNVYGIEFVLADSWYKIGLVGTIGTGVLLLLLNIFLLNCRFADDTPAKESELSWSEMRMNEFREAGSKKYSTVIILPLLVMAVMSIQWEFLVEGLATLNIFFATILYQGAVNRGADEVVLEMAKAGTPKK